MSVEKKQKSNEPIKKVADDFDDFKLFLKKKKIQNEVLKKLIEKPIIEPTGKKSNTYTKTK